MDGPQPIWRSLREPTETPRPLLLALVVVAAAGFAWINIHNAQHGTPQWSQDLAFFHQWVHSAATGGPWASPLILEPQGFFTQVHTHLVMPGVVAAYSVVPGQATLLALHSLFVCLAIIPAYRLGQATGGGRHAILATIAVLAFGPFQAVAVADFRPVGLFLPGILGVWSSSWRGSYKGILLWAAVALLGRQEASYLLVSSGCAMLAVTWGNANRRHALLLIGIGALSWASFTALKPEMFFHINPLAPSGLPESTELWAQRLTFGGALLVSTWWLGLLRPAPLLAMLPVVWGMLTTGREWHALTGPGAHHHAFWLPFVLAAGIAGSARIPRGVGPLALILGGALAFPWATTTEKRSTTPEAVHAIPDADRVAADYDTIHLLSGRLVLWNVDQLFMPDRPWHWKAAWPLTPNDVDWIVAPKGHQIEDRLGEWNIVEATDTHRVFKRPN